MMKELIKKFIENNEEEAEFTGGVDEKRIREVENKLNVNFPESYKWFLREYGFGSIFGVEILGCGKSKLPSVVRETERYRSLGLDNKYVVIQNCDEWVQCLDLSSIKNDDCKVVSWDRINGFRRVSSDGFYSFLISSFEEGKELWEEEF